MFAAATITCLVTTVIFLRIHYQKQNQSRKLARGGWRSRLKGKNILVWRYRRTEHWLFYLFASSCFLLILTGFYFALLAPSGRYGIWILLHFAAGAIFALTLPILMIVRARMFNPFIMPWQKGNKRTEKGTTKGLPGCQLVTGWLLAVLGFMQILTALLLMVPLYPTNTAMKITVLHRYGALMFLITLLIYGYQNLFIIEKKK